MLGSLVRWKENNEEGSGGRNDTGCQVSSRASTGMCSTAGRTVFLALRERRGFSMAREAFGPLGLYNIFFQS